MRDVATSSRLTAIDAVRGLVMVIMALDHVRDFIHNGAMVASPTNLATTTPLLFFTRWITHVCAPAFALTAGLGAYLWWRRGNHSRGELSRFLLTRGLWLLVLELVVMRLLYNFDLAQSYPFLLLVLWALGLSMIVLAALIWVPVPALAGLAVAVMLGHNLLDRIPATTFGAAAPLWNLLHQPGVFTLGGKVMIVGYPLIPWVAVMALGFCLGALYQWEPAVRRRALARAGVAMIVGFVVLRAINAYGDPFPWSAQPSGGYTILSFLNTTKYPASLAFLLMTLGPTFLLLAWADGRAFSPANPLVVFGRVPLFYYVVHFGAAHVVAALLAIIKYGGAAFGFIFHPVPSMGAPPGLYPEGFGYSLWVAYAVWIAIVVGLYPLCRWFAGVKARRRDWWLAYL